MPPLVFSATTVPASPFTILIVLTTSSGAASKSAFMSTFTAEVCASRAVANTKEVHTVRVRCRGVNRSFIIMDPVRGGESRGWLMNGRLGNDRTVQDDPLP